MLDASTFAEMIFRSSRNQPAMTQLIKLKYIDKMYYR